jgi:hypothetical protein
MKTCISSPKQRVKFTPKEDSTLRLLVYCYGVNNWQMIANMIGTKTQRQVKERWEEHLDEKINKSEWKPEEDKIILSNVDKLGKKWKAISKMLQGRTGEQCKNRFNQLMRKALKTESLTDSLNTQISSELKPVAHYNFFPDDFDFECDFIIESSWKSVFEFGV